MPSQVLIHPSSGILTFQMIRVGGDSENRVLALAVQIRVDHLENTLWRASSWPIRTSRSGRSPARGCCV